MHRKMPKRPAATAARETRMLGLMQEQPLLISGLIEFAKRHHHDAPIVSRRVEGDIHRYTYADAARRARQIARGAGPAGQLGFSDRVATLAWNGYRHFELYFGISGSGRVCHTINPRLAPEQMAWIANHAEDQVLCFDLTFLPIVKAIWPQCKTREAVDRAVRRRQAAGRQRHPGPALATKSWIGGEPADYSWPEFDERSAAALCYTSGTTGNPKGALYSHRSTVLHAYGAALPDGMAARRAT